MHRDKMCAHGRTHASISHIPGFHHLALFWGLINAKLGLKYHKRAQGRRTLTEDFNNLHETKALQEKQSQLRLQVNFSKIKCTLIKSVDVVTMLQ